MSRFVPLIGLLVLMHLSACNPGNDGPPTILSDEAAILRLELEHQGFSYLTEVNGLTLSLKNPLPPGTETIRITTLDISPRASASRQPGEVLHIGENPITIEVTAENGRTKRSYLLELEVADFTTQLFEFYSESDCGLYATLDLDHLKIENNVWNASGLAPNSYSQCIYTYKNEGLSLFGWQWAYPSDAFGVNAYPQVIYGWKPWQTESTTPLLPKSLSAISQLKVHYEVDVDRNTGNYNLAFDNWIHSSAAITPQNILFEFMIWEDTHDLLPFGDFQETVETTHGTYDFYRGEPDWEPPGSNWTYLAFQRTENRNQGTVDIDELLQFLIDREIVSDQHVLASIEFGNEVGNSTGSTIVKQFEIELE